MATSPKTSRVVVRSAARLWANGLSGGSERIQSSSRPTRSDLSVCPEGPSRLIGPPRIRRMRRCPSGDPAKNAITTTLPLLPAGPRRIHGLSLCGPGHLEFYPLGDGVNCPLPLTAAGTPLSPGSVQPRHASLNILDPGRATVAYMHADGSLPEDGPRQDVHDPGPGDNVDLTRLFDG